MMFLLYGIVLVMVLGGVPVLFYRQYRAGGPLALVKLLLVLWGVVSGGMWLMNLALPPGEFEATAQMGETVAWFLSLPWGAIWIVDTCLIVAFSVWVWLANRHSPSKGTV